MDRTKEIKRMNGATYEPVGKPGDTIKMKAEPVEQKGDGQKWAHVKK